MRAVETIPATSLSAGERVKSCQTRVEGDRLVRPTDGMRTRDKESVDK
jgi:hypothetical protein